MFQLGPWEIILILVIVLIIFGPGRLPKLARAIGEAVREFKKAEKGILEEPTQSTTKTESEDVLMEMAKKLGIETEGKSRDEILAEVIKRVK